MEVMEFQKRTVPRSFLVFKGEYGFSNDKYSDDDDDDDGGEKKDIEDDDKYYFA